MPWLGAEREKPGGEGGLLRVSAVHWKQLGVLGVGLQFPVFSTVVTQAHQHSAWRAKRTVQRFISEKE